MSKGSDINVGSIEEDIKILQELMEDVELTFAGWVDILNEREKKALKNLIQDYTRQKQINEEHQKLNGELRERVKELEQNIEKQKKLTMLAETITDESIKEALIEFEKEYISKQKIKEKFEKIQSLYEKNLKEVNLKEVEKIDRKIFEGISLEAQRELARELLQESEDK